VNSDEQNLRSELKSISDALTITSPTSFRFADLPAVTVDWASGSANSIPDDDEEPQADAERQRRALIETVSDVLYWNCYVQRFGAEPARPLTPLEIPPDAEFQRALSAANQSISRWDPGWSVVQTGFKGEVQVRKGESHRAPVPGEFLFEDRPGIPPQRGDTVSIRVVRESTLLQPGFYFCFSEQIPDQFEEFNSIRVYFNLRPAGAPVLLHELSGRLNRFQVPFRFKCPVAPHLFNRRDSGVLYVPWRFLPIASRCIVEMLPQLDSFLEDDTPLFVKRVRPGVGMAEDPGELRSFGQYRCELLAGGLVDAWHDNVNRSASANIHDVIERRFHEVGVTLEQPWLNPGSRDWLELPEDARHAARAAIAHDDDRERTGGNTAVHEASIGNVRNDEYLQAADRIGSRICREAVWSGTLCNWLEWDVEPLRNNWVPVHRALGSSPVFPLNGLSLYSGTAGISLFLARLYRFSQDPIHRATAVASARQVLEQVRIRSLRTSGSGLATAFYTGWLGAAWALTEIGHETNDDELIEAAVHELDAVAESEPSIPNTDVINGSAGLIVALIDLAFRFEKPQLLNVARQHGYFLLEAAQKSEHGWSWETVSVPVHHNLTGYGHGVSGIACALAELYRATGDERFATAVHEGLRYESHYFSSADQNWHDHRTDVATEDESAFQFGWCHGAPGIGMARFQLLELGFDSELIRRDLEAATQTTLSKLSYQNAAGQNAFCLCHGLAGNCELPLLLSESSAPEMAVGRDDLLQAIDRVAHTGIELFDETRVAWSCNLAATGETPVLFNGMAGIGYFYLRAYAQNDVPSVMVLRPGHESS
jgi:hypothetical protein